LILTRIETWVSAGVPDLLICDEKGRFHMIELKFTTSNAVDLRPHQVAWLSKHQHASSWVMVKKQKKPTEDAELFLFKAKDVVDLKMDGMGKVEPAYHCKQPFTWNEVWDLICPI